MVAVDRSQCGDCALIGGSSDKAKLPVGAVVVEADCDDTMRVRVVAFDGTLVSLRDHASGMVLWTSYKDAARVVCDRVEVALHMPQLTLLEDAVADLTLRVAACSGKSTRQILAEAIARLAAFAASASSVDRASLAAERVVLAARIAEIDRILTLEA